MGVLDVWVGVLVGVYMVCVVDLVYLMCVVCWYRPWSGMPATA